MSYRRRFLTFPKILLSFAVAVAGSLATALLMEGGTQPEADAFGGLLIPLCVGAILFAAMLLLLARFALGRGGQAHFYTQVEGLSTLTFPPESRLQLRVR